MLKSKRKARSRSAPGTVSPATSTDSPQPLSLKARLMRKRKADRLRQELIRFTTLTVLFATFVGFVVGLTIAPKAGIAVTVGLLYTALSFKYPRQALWAFLIYMPFSGSVTYAIGNSPLLQLAKDGFYIPALFGVIQYCRREKLPILIPKPLIPAVGLLLAIALLTLIFVNLPEQFNPEIIGQGDQPILIGILGLKVLVGYIPLIVCAYYLIRNRQDLLFLTRLTIAIVLAACGLAFVQYLLLKIGYCAGTRYYVGEAQFRPDLEARCLVGGALLYSPQVGQIRLPGTFVAPWQWGWFLISSLFLTFAAAFNDPRKRWRILGLTAIAAVFIMAVLSGQRIALAVVPVMFGLLLIVTGQMIYLKRFLPTAITLFTLLGLVAVNNPQVLQERIASLESRWNASPPPQFIYNQFQQAIEAQTGLLGLGLGRATNSARVFGETELIETYYPKLLYEVGLFGVLAFLLVVTVLCFLTWRASRSIRDSSLHSYGTSFWVFVLFISYNTYFYPLDVDPVAVYYWFFAGVILKLPEIERQERLEAAAQTSQTPLSKRRRRLRRPGFA